MPVQAQGLFDHFSAQAVLVMDAKTGEVFYQENAERKLPVYSVSKLMTAYITLQSIESGKLKWEQLIPIDETLAEISEVYAFTNVPLTAGMSYTVRDLFQAMLVQSANAATMALAKAISGSEASFVRTMNTYAQTLQLKQSQFVSSSGLERSDLLEFGIEIAEGGNQMSAVDVAYLWREILVKYPDVAQITQASQMWFNEGDEIEKFLMTTSNPLLPGAAQAMPGFLGGKSGFGGLDGTAAYVAALHNEQHALISVVIGSMNMSDVYETTRQLLEYGLTIETNNTFASNSLESSQLLQKIHHEFAVINGEKNNIEINFSTVIPAKYQNYAQYQFTFIPTSSNFQETNQSFQAPIMNGQELGVLKISKENKQLETITVYAEETIAVRPLSWWQKLVKIIIEIF